MKFCFYGSGIYEALIGNPPGGAELQVALIAKVLSDKGHQVIIIDNKGSGKENSVGNLTVQFTARTNIRGLRYIFEKIPNSFRYLLKAKADFYYIRGFSLLNIIVLYVAKRVNAKLILGIATDIDVLSFYKRFFYVFNTRTSIYNWVKNDIPASLAGKILLKKADYRLVQHANQRKALHEQNIRSNIFSNILPPMNEKLKHIEDDSFIYAGSLNERKGFSELLWIIQNYRKINIKIIGKPYGSFAIKKTEEFNVFKNVRYKGQYPREKVLLEIASSKGLLNFSRMEGFPNTFIEAWSFGIPVFSLWVDPGGVIEKFNLGKCFNGNISLMADFVNNFKYNGPSEKIKEYVKIYHSYENAANRFLEIISIKPQIK